MKTNQLSLADSRRLVDIPLRLQDFEPAHLSRYFICASLIKLIHGKNHAVKALDVGGKKGLLPEFGINTTVIDIEKSSEKNYVQGDALDMPFEDNSFDAVISCDVLEHIPQKRRGTFIAEIVRVSKNYSIICAPFNEGGVSDSEKKANQFYKGVTKKDHRWLVEHIENGLPKTKDTESSLDRTGLNYQRFSHLSLDVWDVTTKLHFLNAMYGDNKIIDDLAKQFYRKYYEVLCAVDFSSNGYRTFFVINKNAKFKFELPEESAQSAAKTEYLEFVNQGLINGLKDLALEVNVHNKRAQRTVQLELELKKARNENQGIKDSRSWRLARQMSKARNFYK
jgi:hypothetical protein